MSWHPYLTGAGVVGIATRAVCSLFGWDLDVLPLFWSRPPLRHWVLPYVSIALWTYCPACATDARYVFPSRPFAEISCPCVPSTSTLSSLCRWISLGVSLLIFLNVSSFSILFFSVLTCFPACNNPSPSDLVELHFSLLCCCVLEAYFQGSRLFLTLADVTLLWLLMAPLFPAGMLFW